MRRWIGSLRLPGCILTGLLTIASFKIASVDAPWVVVASVCFITGATMVQNDWRDRFHDVRKGKTLALEHPGPYILWLLSLWAICAALIGVSATEDLRLGVMLALMAVGGVVYSETRKVPFLPLVMVALTLACVVMLPFVAGADAPRLWLLFVATVAIACGRELTKDMEDRAIDEGYKWTVPLAWGERYSRVLAVIAIGASLAVLVRVSLAALLGAPLTVVAVIMLARGKSLTTSRMYLDSSTALMILALITLG